MYPVQCIVVRKDLAEKLGAGVVATYLGLAAGRLFVCVGSLMGAGALIAGVVQARLGAPMFVAVVAAGAGSALIALALAWLLGNSMGYRSPLPRWALGSS